MDQTEIHLPWGKNRLHLNLPEGWKLQGVLEPSPKKGIADPAEECQRSLENPIGLPRLSELVKPSMRIVLVIDDLSRPTPIAQLLPPVLAEIERGGGRRENITVVAALGVHRKMTFEEHAARLGGEDRLAGLNIVDHDCDDPKKLVFLGMTSRGTPVYLNRTVAESDLIVSIGCIEPHVIASFGGGYKNLLPGVAGRTAIAHNHTLNCRPSTFNMVGQPIENNPMRLDLEEACKMLKQPVFLVNAVINSALEVVKIVSGDPIEAHRAGVDVSQSIYGVRSSLADVVINASHPMDTDLRQGVKALSNTIRAVRKGGVMINLIRAEEGVGVFGLANRKLPLSKGMLRLLAPLLIPLVPKLKLKGMGEEDRFFLYFALQAMRHCTLLLYAPTIPEEIHERLPFVTFVSSPEEAIRLAQEKAPKKAKVLVFPHGGMTYPILG